MRYVSLTVVNNNANDQSAVLHVTGATATAGNKVVLSGGNSLNDASLAYGQSGSVTYSYDPGGNGFLLGVKPLLFVTGAQSRINNISRNHACQLNLVVTSNDPSHVQLNIWGGSRCREAFNIRPTQVGDNRTAIVTVNYTGLSEL